MNDLPDAVICNIAIYADDTTFYFRCHQASDLRQQLKLASELKSDLQDNLDWGIVDCFPILISMLVKLSLFCLTGLITLELLM